MNPEINLGKDQHPFLRDLSAEHLAIVLHNARRGEYAEGEIILRQGQPANRFFLIERGTVAVEAGGDHGALVQCIGPGEVLGWSWLFPPFSWNLSARALEPVTCLVLDGAHLLVTAESDSKFGYALMRKISKILISRLQAMRERVLEGAMSMHP